MTRLITAALHRGHVAFRRAVALVAAAAILAGAPACSDSSTGPKGPGGTYALALLDDFELPAVIHHGPHFDAQGHFYNQYIASVVDGEIVLDGDHFQLYLAIDVVADGQPFEAELELEGTFEMDGEDLYLTTDAGAELFAVRDGRAVLMPLDLMGYGNGFTYRFER